MNQHKIKILAFGAHPDDVELGCGGTLIKHATLGHSFGIIDLTRGELGTRGAPQIRLLEATKAANIMGAAFRENLNFRDGFFINDEPHQLAVIKMIRKYQPDIVLANAFNDRHPDHQRAALLLRDACFLSGLVKIETDIDGQIQEAWRPKSLYHYIQDLDLTPDFVIDISDFVEKKMQAILSFDSQFYNPNSTEPSTYISGSNFLNIFKSRMQLLGKNIGVPYAEGFTSNKIIGVENLANLL